MLKACSSLSTGDIFITSSQLKSSGLKLKYKTENTTFNLKKKILYYSEFEVMDMEGAT